jgi:cation:H+ antiporter
MDVTRALVFKEAQFYIISMAVLLLVFSLGVIYYPVGGPDGPALGEMNRLLASLPIMLYGLYIFIQYQDTADHESTEDISDVRPPYSWFLLTVSLLIILVGVELLVRSAIEFGDLLGTPSFLWGMTIVAAGTSVPDAIMSVRTAVEQNPETSLANVLGSNVFDLLVCIPAGVMVAGSTVVNFTVVAPMMGFLILGTVFLFTFMRTELVLTDGEAWTLLFLYGLFVVWLVAEYFYWLNLLPGVP